MRPSALLVTALVFFAQIAHAGRALEEPAGLGKALKRATAAELHKALVDVGGAAAAERCKAALAPSAAASTSSDLLVFECRAAAVASWQHTAKALKPTSSKADVDARAALLADLLAAADQVSTWAPLSPPPGLARARFDAHRAISRAAMTTLDDLVAISGSANAKGPLVSKAAACKAAQRSLDLGVGADASLEERGALQSLLTSHQCGLDESKLRVEPKPGAALKDSADAASVAASTSSSGAILAYAQSRSLDLERCQKHLDIAGRPKDTGKLEQCACGAIARWSLPHSPSAKEPVKARVPVVGASSVDLEVTPAGAVTKCALAAP